MASTNVPTIEPSLQIKPPFQAFGPRQQPKSQVSFLHPGYPDHHNILLILPALDSGGIHHETARVACALLSDLQWEGFLSLTKDGLCVAEGPDELLMRGRYYFRIEGGDEKYPVVPSFNNFRFCSLPPSWSTSHAPIQQSSLSDINQRDLTCRITASAIPNESAHIIPQAHSAWWQLNTMFIFIYTDDPDVGLETKCADNTILMRRDLHKMWDDHRFAMVPKAGKWMIHILRESPTSELAEIYHNRELQPLSGVAREFFLCRFALAIISKSCFLGQNTTRTLITAVSSGTPKVRSMSANEYKDGVLFYGVDDPRGDEREGHDGPPRKRRPSLSLDKDYLLSTPPQSMSPA